MSIFVSIASYRDPELIKTIKSLIENSDNPGQLYFGIVSQEARNRHQDFEWLGDNARVIKMHYKDARGAGYARKLAMELYDGQNYFLQIDSHMRFEKSWDTRIVKVLEDAQSIAKTDKVILSQFPAPYMVLTDGSDYYLKGDENFWDFPSWTSVENTWGGFWSGKREKIENLSVPHKTHTILAGYVFAPGEIVKEVPYDERISFMGEELCFSIRAYTRGWELYAPNEMLCWHFYKREENPKIWNDNLIGRTWNELEMESQRIQERVLLGEEQGIFGIDNIERYLEYQKMIGIDFPSFYKKELPRSVNLGTLTKEIEFDENFDLVEISKSGYCINNFHDECRRNTVCMCKCHKEE